MEKKIANASLIGLIGCGLCIFFINAKVKSSTWRYHNGLTRSLWKITNPLSMKERLNEYCWSWRKLVLCACMVTFLAMMMTIRILGVTTTVRVGVCMFTGLCVLLWVVWLKYFIPLLTETQPGNDKPPSLTKNRDPLTGWASKTVVAASDGKIDSQDCRLPVTVITGFLGSGKTTLIKQMLNNSEGMKILVIENEIGEEGIDHELLLQQAGKEEIILMNNGCICCSVRKDLLTVFHKLFADEAFSSLNWIVIETTGVADPAPLIQSLYMDEQCRKRMRLDAVLAVVDSKHLPSHVLQSSSDSSGIHGGLPEAVQQLACADRILVNKCDLVTEEELEKIFAIVCDINPTAQVLTCQHGVVALADLLNLYAFDARNSRAISAITTDAPLIQLDASGKILRKRTMFVASKKGSTENSGVSAISLTTRTPLELNLLNDWICSLLRNHGNDLYRMKGIFHVAGFDQQFIAHGVHMVFDGEVGQSWPPEESIRVSKVVLIGKNLNGAELKRSFLSCCTIK